MSSIEKCDVNPEHFKHFHTVRDSSARKVGVDVLRCDIKNGNDAKEWVEEYSKLTKTEWIVERNIKRPQRSEFCKWWCCHHASKNKKADNNSRGKNTNCKARLNVTIKKMTANVLLRDRFLQGSEPLRGVVKIHAAHNHPLNSSDSMRILRASRHIRLMFEDYFSRGLPPSSAKRLHESKLSMEENASDLLSDLSVNPLDRTVQYWYTSWRKLDYKKQVDPSEADTSAKAALLWETTESSGFDDSETDFDQSWSLQDEDYEKEGDGNTGTLATELHCEDESLAVAEETDILKTPSPSSHLYFELTKPLNNSSPPPSARSVKLPMDHPSTTSTICQNFETGTFTTSCSPDKLSRACNTLPQCTTVPSSSEKLVQTNTSLVPNYHLILSSNSLVDKQSPVFSANSQSQSKCADKSLQMPDTPLYQVIVNPQCLTSDKSFQVSKPLDSRSNMSGGSTTPLAGNNVPTLSNPKDPSSSASSLEIKCLPPFVVHNEKSLGKQNVINQMFPETSGMEKLLRMPTDIKSLPSNLSAMGQSPPNLPMSTSKGVGLQNLLLVQFPPAMLPPSQAYVQKGQPQSQLLLLQSPVPQTPMAPGQVSKVPTQSQPRLILFQLPQSSVQPPSTTNKISQSSGQKPPPVVPNNADPKLQQTLPVPPLISINRVGQSGVSSDVKTTQLVQQPPITTTVGTTHLQSPPIFQMSSGESQHSLISSKLPPPSDLQRLGAESTVLFRDISPGSLIVPSLDMLNLIAGSPIVNPDTSLKGTHPFPPNSVNPATTLVSSTNTVALNLQPQPDVDVVGRITSELVRIRKLCQNPATFERTAPRILQCLKKIHTSPQAANALFRMSAALSITTKNFHDRSTVAKSVKWRCRTARRKCLATNRKHKDRRKKRCDS